MLCFFCAPPVGQSMKRTEGKGIVLSCEEQRVASAICLTAFPSALFVLTFPCDCWCPPPQLSSGMGRGPLPASLRHQAERLEGLPRIEHREGEVAGVPQDKEGLTHFSILLISAIA